MRRRISKQRNALSPAELAKLGDTLRKLESDGANPAAVANIRLLAFTGARKSEIANLRWSEVDFDRDLLRLEDSKSGPKIIPLGAPAREVPSQQRPYDKSPTCFRPSLATVAIRAWRRSGGKCGIWPAFPLSRSGAKRRRRSCPVA